jgi:Ca-activated chloride channel family protein
VKKTTLILFIFLSCGIFLFSQDANRSIQSGNNFYRNKQYKEAEAEYQKALQASPGHPVASYNYANALYRDESQEQAIKVLDSITRIQGENNIREGAFYNAGAIFSLQYEKTKDAGKKMDSKPDLLSVAADAILQKSIDLYKNALRINPGDKEARENLQKALLELKKKSPPPKKDDKKKKEQQKQPPKPKISPKEAQQELKLLEQKEKQVQQKLQKNSSKTGNSLPKDW